MPLRKRWSLTDQYTTWDPVSFHINPLEDVTRAVTDKNKDLAQQGTQNQPRRGKLMYVDHLLVEPISIWLLD